VVSTNEMHLPEKVHVAQMGEVMVRDSILKYIVRNIYELEFRTDIIFLEFL
jgi:hypothetical protein